MVKPSMIVQHFPALALQDAFGQNCFLFRYQLLTATSVLRSYIYLFTHIDGESRRLSLVGYSYFPEPLGRTATNQDEHSRREGGILVV